MEREHLIIIALILVALYMMNKDTKDTVMGMGPASRIRYEDPCANPYADGCPLAGPPKETFAMPQRIRYSDKYIAQSQHIKNHIRHGNRNASFKGLIEGGCGSDYKPEPFRFTCPEGTPEQDCINPSQYP